MKSEEYIADLEELRDEVAQKYGKGCQYVQTLTEAIRLVEKDTGKIVVYHNECKTPSFSYGDISDKSQYVKD